MNHDAINNPAHWIREHGPRLILYARQWVKNVSDAEDAVQEAFVNFWPKRSHAKQPLAYLYTCVRNAAMNMNRKSQSDLRKIENAGQTRPMFEVPTNTLEQIESTQMLTQALDQLTSEQKEVVVLRIWSNLPFSDIAEIIQTPEPTARSRYRYALSNLQSLMQDEVDYE